MLSFCEQNKFSVFDYVPITFVLDYEKANFFEELQKFENVF